MLKVVYITRLYIHFILSNAEIREELKSIVMSVLPTLFSDFKFVFFIIIVFCCD